MTNSTHGTHGNSHRRCDNNFGYKYLSVLCCIVATPPKNRRNASKKASIALMDIPIPMMRAWMQGVQSFLACAGYATALGGSKTSMAAGSPAVPPVWIPSRAESWRSRLRIGRACTVSWVCWALRRGKWQSRLFGVAARSARLRKQCRAAPLCRPPSPASSWHSGALHVDSVKALRADWGSFLLSVVAPVYEVSTRLQVSGWFALFAAGDL